MKSHKAGKGAAVKPRIGVVGLAYGGYNLGEEMGPGKLQEMLGLLKDQPFDVVRAPGFVLDETGAKAAGDYLAGQGVDCILAVITTFVPDTFMVSLLDACDRPIFLWAVEREMACISVVCGPLITATLHNLEKPCRIAAADIGDLAAMTELGVFARAAMLVRVLSTMRVGYCGGKCPIMISMATDEYALKRQLGVTTVTLPIEEFYQVAEAIPAKAVAAYWADLTSGIGAVTASEEDGLLSSRYALAALKLAETHNLSALSLNCFPHLKSKICLGVARLNDAGIAAGCEGDLHATILMRLFQALSGRPTFNGDWLRLYPEDKAVLFSHCGAGAFGLADSPESVCLRCSIETRDGLAVCYATHLPGPVTLANLMMGRGDLRMAILQGQGLATDLAYEGTPLRVGFEDDVKVLLNRIQQTGAGHHWVGGSGIWTEEFRIMSEMLNMKCHRLTGPQQTQGDVK